MNTMNFQQHLLLQLNHTLDRLLYRRLVIKTMTVKKINSLHPQALQTLLTRLPCILGVIFDHKLAILQHTRKLGRQEDVVPLAGPLKPFANQVLTVGIDVRRVPERLAHFVRFVQNPEAVLIRLDFAVETRKAHGAEAEGGDLGTLENMKCQRHVLKRGFGTTSG